MTEDKKNVNRIIVNTELHASSDIYEGSTRKK